MTDPAQQPTSDTPVSQGETTVYVSFLAVITLLFAFGYLLFVENTLPDAAIFFTSTETCDIRAPGQSYNYYGSPTTWDNHTVVALTGVFMIIQLVSHRFLYIPNTSHFVRHIRLIPTTCVLLGEVLSSYGEIFRLISALQTGQVATPTISDCGPHRGTPVIMTYGIDWDMTTVLFLSVACTVVLFLIELVSAIRDTRQETDTTLGEPDVLSMV